MQPPYGNGPPGPGGQGQPPGGPPPVYGQPPGSPPPGYGPNPYGAPPGYGGAPQPPPKKGMSAGVIVLMILGVLVLLGFGTCAVVIGVAASAAKKTADLALTPKVSVTCDGNPAKGFECNVTQISGATGANVCWDVHVGCENGAQVDGHACQAVHLGSKASRFVSAAEMTHTKTCNRAQSTSVLNVVATPM